MRTNKIQTVMALMLMMIVTLVSYSARAACTYPKGSVGTQVANPAVGYITAISVNPSDSSQWLVTYTYSDPLDGSPVTGPISFGDGTSGAGFASFSGSGWSGGITNPLTKVEFRHAPHNGCALNYSGRVCVRFNDVDAMEYDVDVSPFITINGTSVTTFPSPVTKIRGMGPVNNSRNLRFYFIENGVMASDDAFLTYKDPPGCTASIAAPSDWRYALTPRAPHPDALTIERLLHG